MLTHYRLHLENGFDMKGRLRPAGSNGAEPHTADTPASFSALDTLSLGIPQRMALPLLAVGFGTTGSKVVHNLAQTVRAENPAGELPSAFEYLPMDAAVPQPEFDALNFHAIPGGIDGSGTHPLNGHRLFFTQENYQQLRHTLNSKVLNILRGLEAVASGQRAANFLLVAGNGGTSGAMDRAIGLLHDVAQERRVQIRVHVLFIGAEISVRDKNRQVTVQQQRLVRATASLNLRKILRDMITDGFIQEPRPDGTTFPVRASERVWSLILADQSNGVCDHATVDDLIHMLTKGLYLRFFTQAGTHLAERICDLRNTGEMGLAKAN